MVFGPDKSLTGRRWRAEAAGIVVGARVPVILTSRADNDKARLASCALAQLYDYWRHHGEPLKDKVGPRLH